MANHKDTEVMPESKSGLSRRRASAEYRRYLIALYWKRGTKNHRIIMGRLADKHEIRVERSTVTKDILAIRKVWRESAVTNYGEAQMQVLEEIEDLKANYWDAWSRSCEEFKASIKTTETSEGSGKGIEKHRATEKIEERDGDPRYLDGVEWCVQKQIDILGLDAPIKTEDVT